MTDSAVNWTDVEVSQTRPLLTLMRRITHFFQPPTTEHRLNEAWHDPINDDAEGRFRLYFQNPHGLSRNMVSLGQDLSQCHAKF